MEVADKNSGREVSVRALLEWGQKIAKGPTFSTIFGGLGLLGRRLTGRTSGTGHGRGRLFEYQYQVGCGIGFFQIVREVIRSSEMKD